MLEVSAVLLGLLQSVAAVIDEIVYQCRCDGLLQPDAATLLVLRATPSTVDNGVVIYSHLRQRYGFAVAGIGELESIGAGIIDDVVGYVELTSRLYVYSLAAVSSIAAVRKDAVINHALTTGEVGLVVVVVVQEAVCHHELSVDVTEVEGRYATVDGGLEEFVLERYGRLGRCGSGITKVDMIEHHLLRVISADDASPRLRLLRVGGESHGMFGCSHAIEVAEHHNLDGHLHVRLACDGHARFDVERCAHRYLHAFRQSGVFCPYH